MSQSILGLMGEVGSGGEKKGVDRGLICLIVLCAIGAVKLNRLQLSMAPAGHASSS